MLKRDLTIKKEISLIRFFGIVFWRRSFIDFLFYFLNKFNVENAYNLRHGSHAILFTKTIHIQNPISQPRF